MCLTVSKYLLTAIGNELDQWLTSSLFTSILAPLLLGCLVLHRFPIGNADLYENFEENAMNAMLKLILVSLVVGFNGTHSFFAKVCKAC